MRSPSATSSGPTVHMMTRCDFPMYDMLTPFTNRVRWPSSDDSLRLRPSVGWCGETAAEAASHAEPRPRVAWASVLSPEPHLSAEGRQQVIVWDVAFEATAPSQSGGCMRWATPLLRVRRA